jgi:sulfonate transport system permease protein
VTLNAMPTKGAAPLVSIITVITFLAIWELAPRAGIVDAMYTSQPSRVFAAGLEIVSTERFLHDVAVSLSEFAIGFALAIGIGVPVGLLLGRFPLLRHLIDPPIMAIYATPHLALLPIIVVWLGIGMASKIAAVFAGAVIPILVNSMAGVRGVERSWVAAARSFCAGEWDVFVKVILPASLPSVILGIRLGVSRAVLGVVVGEMYQSQAGIGNEIMRYGSEFRTDYLLFDVLLVSLFGFTSASVMRALEGRLWTTGK